MVVGRCSSELSDPKPERNQKSHSLRPERSAVEGPETRHAAVCVGGRIKSPAGLDAVELLKSLCFGFVSGHDFSRAVKNGRIRALELA
jgi:hypothetical protein